MFFGATAFGQSPFGAVGETTEVITVTPTGQTLTLTLSNAYTVQKTHFVNGFNLSLAQGSVTPQIIPQENNFNTTVSLNSPIVSADGTIHLPANSLGMTVSLGATIGISKFIATGTSISTTVNNVSVSGTALPTINTNLITSAVGSVLTGTTVTGNTLTSAVGSVSLQLSPVAAVSGTTVTSSVNSVIPGWSVSVSGQSMTLSLNSVGVGYGVNVSGNSLTSAVGTTSAFTFSDVDDTTTATIPLTPVDTTGAGGSSWTEVDESGAGTIEGEAA